MSKISIKNIAKAIYESSINKDGASLDFVVKNTLTFLHDKRLLGKSKKILEELEKIVNKEEGSLKVKIHSRHKLSKQNIDEIENFIKERYKVKSVIIDEKEDEKLLGGVKIEVGDEVMDLTLKNKIHKLQNYLINN